MKNVYVFLLVLLISAGLQSMEQEDVLFSSIKSQLIEQEEELLDLQEIQNTLKSHVKISLTNYFNQIDKAEWNIEKLLEKTKWITGSVVAVEEVIKEYRDLNNNTVTHLLVMNASADNLYTCAQNNLILCTKNTQGKTPFDVILQQLFKDIDNMLKDDCSDDPISSRCCLYILSEYMKHKELVYEKLDICPICCAEHGLTSYH